MKRRIVVFACLLCTLFLLVGAVGFAKGASEPAAKTQAAAGGTWPRDPNLNAPGTFPIAKKKVSLSIGVAQNPVIENWKTNLQTQELEKRGNFDLSFIQFPADAREMVQKIELMVMAGGNDLPDVILGDVGGQANLVRYGKAGMIVPLNDYYKNLAHFTKESQKNIAVDCLKYVTSYDGNIYGMFNIMESLNNSLSPGRIMVYEPWLKDMGRALPQSTDEFTDMLRAFKDKDPNKNGKPDEIPLVGEKAIMTSNYAYAMMMPFVYTQANYWTVENGKIGAAFTTNGWREGLRYTRQLIQQGLLSPLSFTQDRAQMTSLISPDPAKVGAFVGVSSSLLGAKDLKRGEYVIVPPLKGPTGRREQYNNPSLPGVGMVITKNCKNPEAAFLLGDLLCSEELSLWTRWGRKGIDWVVPEAGEKSVYDAAGYKAVLKVISTAWGTMQNIWWAQVGPYIVDARYPVGQVATPSPYDHNAPLGRSIAPAIQFAAKNPIVGLIYNEKEQETITELQNTILTYARESFTRFAMGDMNLDTDWDKYLAEFGKMGLDKVIAATQTAYDRMNK